MSNDISKLCADFLRETYTSQTGNKLKASHARELIAAFFGYKSHAALIARQKYPLDSLEDAGILIPDIPLLDKRKSCLNGLPEDLFPSMELASSLCDFLTDEGLFGGDAWLYESLENYVMEVLLIDSDSLICDELSGVMAETNAAFEDFPYYEDPKVVDTGDSLEITVSGNHKGRTLDDKPFCGDTIKFAAKVILYRVAGKRGFQDFDIEAGGSVNDDWRDPEMHYETSKMRPKDQFLEMTGGFRFGETREQLQHRQTEIHAIRNRIAKGQANVQDIDRLSHLMGTDDDELEF